MLAPSERPCLPLLMHKLLRLVVPAASARPPHACCCAYRMLATPRVRRPSLHPRLLLCLPDICDPARSWAELELRPETEGREGKGGEGEQRRG
jgi:hypothetical protein